MAKQFDALVKSIFPGNCFEELLIKFNVFHPTCSKMVLSRVLGLGITVGSILLFVPQILKIAAAKSGKGISLVSLILSLIGAIATSAYSYKKGFVFSQWGDSFFVTVQLVLIINQIYYYNGQIALIALFSGLVGAVTFGVVADLIPMSVIVTLQALTVPIVVSSKGIQCWENFSSKSTGQLSLISVFMQFAGTVARVFTSIQETGDQLLIGTFAIAAILNGFIFAQFFLYWNSAETTEKKKQ